MAISTLWDYYASKGQALPSVAQRRTDYGLGSDYTGTAAQNTALLQKLLGGASMPAPTATPATTNPTTPTGTTVGTANFDWNQAEQDALAKLTPYYQTLLDKAGGDVEIAKRIMAEDYQTGMRRGQEDFNTQNEAYNRQFPQETNQLMTNLNSRGVLQSTIRNEDTANLTADQLARREAIQRALARTGENLGTTQARGLESTNRTFDQYKLDQEQQKRQEAADMANMTYNRDQSRFLAQTSRFLTS